MSDIPTNWLQAAADDPASWAGHLATMDQAYADANVKLDEMITALAEDILDRPAHKEHADAEPFVALTISVKRACHASGNISTELLAVYNAAMYRLARQRIREWQSE